MEVYLRYSCELKKCDLEVSADYRIVGFFSNNTFIHILDVSGREWKSFLLLLPLH
jgi:hypothetical protein